MISKGLWGVFFQGPCQEFLNLVVLFKFEVCRAEYLGGGKLSGYSAIEP